MKILKVKALNINSLKGEFEIDFEEFLKDESLFAITGPTGSGKSTILDVISCALYGRTARLINPNDLMSRHTGECYCEVEFEIKGIVYRSSWSQKRARKSASGNFQSAKMEISEVKSKKVLESYLSKVPKYIEELSGLDFERFKQSMMLAQGGFDAFLKARENERSSLLEKITGTQIYKQISQEIYNTYLGYKKNIETQETILGSIELLDNKLVEEKTKVLNEEKTNKKDFDKKEEELKKLSSWLETLKMLELSNVQYIKEYEEVSKNKENKKEDFKKLALSNKALNCESLNSSKAALEKSILQDTKAQELLQKELEELNVLLVEKQNEVKVINKQYEDEKITYENNTVKIKQIRELQTKIDEKQSQEKVFFSKIKTQKEEESKLTLALETNKKEYELINNSILEISKELEKTSKDEALKEKLPLIQKAISQYEQESIEAKRIKDELESITKEEELQKQSMKQLQKSFDLVKSSYELLEDEYRILDIKTVDDTANETKLREELKTTDLLIETIKKHTELLSSIKEEDTLITKLKDESSLVKEKVQEKQKLVNEIEPHLETLRAKRETELLVANYKDIRTKLLDGHECFVCGSKEHPFVVEGIKIDVDETTLKIKEKTKQLDSEKAELNALDKTYSVKQSKIESSLLQIAKLNKQITEKEDIFETNALILKDDSIQTLQENKLASTVSLEEIITNRRTKDLILAKRDKTHKELSQKQEVLSNKEKELVKTKERKLNLQEDTKVNKTKIQNIKLELTKEFSFYALAFENEYKENYKTLVLKKEIFETNQTKLKEQELKLQNITIVLKENETKLQNIKKILIDDEVLALNLITELSKLKENKKSILDIEDVNIYEEELNKKHSELTAKQNTSAKELNSISTKDEALKKQLEELIKKLVVENENLKLQEEKFSKALKENDFLSYEEFLKAILPIQIRETLSKECKEIEDKYSQIKTLKEDTTKKLKEQKELNLTVRKLEDIKQELLEIQSSIDTLQKDIGSCEKELEINSINIKKSENKIKELQKQKESFKVWIKLNEMIGSSDGNKFAKFAQGITLDQLIFLANKHLEILSPRYELQRGLDSNKLLEIEIIDGFQGNVVRPVSTLSGGEGFIVSLALALGLSALASQKISIDSLFLDEGFGTLDPDSLELALNALSSLQSSGKMIGVISHVEALKERIPLQIKVNPNGDGTSYISTSF